MRTKLVNRYYCDYCKKAGCSASHMARHEKHCTLNPQRSCGMCEIVGQSPTPLSTLIATLPKLADFAQKECGYTYYDGLEEAVAKAMPALREAANNCPACMFAALRQSGVYSLTIDFDFKAECKAFWDDVNAERDDHLCGTHGPAMVHPTDKTTLFYDEG